MPIREPQAGTAIERLPAADGAVVVVPLALVVDGLGRLRFATSAADGAAAAVVPDPSIPGRRRLATGTPSDRVPIIAIGGRIVL